ncbi:MAG: glycoside hydrolase family 13 protein [Aliiglaciecola sp.]
MKQVSQQKQMSVSRNFILSLSFLFLCVSHLTSAKSIEHLEPAFWWVGMAHPELQLMVHGQEIGLTTPQIDYKGVALTSVETTDNPNFLFINLNLADDVKAGSFDIVFTRNGLTVANYQYELKKREAQSAQREGFSPKDVIYLITPDRFANGDTSNDSMDSLKEQKNRQYKGGRHGGDIQGIINHLDYLDDMGFTQIWTMPLMENDMERYSYHGYSTTDYYQIDPRFGSNELYKSLSQQAKTRGIGIIQDVILNHIGSEHWWMYDRPSSDWINNNYEFTPTTHMRESLHDPHAVESDIVGFNDGWFVPTMPDLNQRNPLLATYLIQNAIWWIEYAGLSGLRVDTYSYSDMDFLSDWTRRVMLEYPNLNIVGEEWSVNPSIVAFWQKGSPRHNEYKSDLPSVMDFPTQVKLVNSLTKSETWATGLRELYESVASDFVYGDPYNLVVFGDNHDMSRIYSQLNEETDLFYMAMTYVLTTRGIPQIFYGTEILMANPGTDDHGIIRTDFPGGWQSDKVNAFTGEGLSKAQRDAQLFMKTLLNWRKTSSAITQGKMKHYTPKDGVYVYFRHSEEQTVMVVLNKNDVSVDLPLARFSKMIGEASHGINVIEKTRVSLNNKLTLSAKSATVLELK